MLSTVKRPTLVFTALAATAVGAFTLFALGGDGTAVAGFHETVGLPDFDMMMEGKLDTGADTTSIHATDIQITGPDDGEQQVTFSIVNGDEISAPVTMEIERYQLLDPRGDCVDMIRRPVVEMLFEIDGKSVPAEVSLADRSELSTDLLVGRNVMSPLGLTINPSESYLITKKIPQPG